MVYLGSSTSSPSSGPISRSTSSGDLLMRMFEKVKNMIAEVSVLIGWNVDSSVSSAPHIPKEFTFLTNGAEKDIYVEAEAANKVTATSRQAYLVGRRTFFGTDALAAEMRKTKEIKKNIYFAALVKFFICQGEPSESAGRLAAEVVKQYPKLDDLVEAMEQESGSWRGGMLLLVQNKRTDQMKRLLNCYAHLGLEFHEEPKIVIDGRAPVYSTLRAEKNLEEEVRGTPHTFLQNVKIIGQLIDGFDSLHTAGIVLNDPKLENMLFYNINGEAVVKISDWGRSAQMSEGDRGLHLGNQRHIPPERLASFKGEVFGVGMMFVRILEEELLQASEETMLHNPGLIDSTKEKQLRNDENPKKRRRGLERFISILSGSPQIDSKPIDKVSHVICSLIAFFCTPSPNERMDQEIGKYLDQLEEKLLEKYQDDDGCLRRQIREVVGVLRDMLKTDPTQRISMKEVSQRWARITK